MSRWKLYDNWEADLPGLTIEQLIERREFADQRPEAVKVIKAGGSA